MKTTKQLLFMGVFAVTTLLLPQFALSQTDRASVRGDVNCDGYATIDDVTCLINYLLTDEAGENFDLFVADMNRDGLVNISDVTSLIDYLLNANQPPTPMRTFTVNGVTFWMVRVECGTFMMGATPEQGGDTTVYGGNYRATPAHLVTLTKNYYMSQTEVTQELWEAVMGYNRSAYRGPQHPVNMVSVSECNIFCQRLWELTGVEFRLPTEAEWEYAARGGNKSRGYKYAGSDDYEEVAWCRETTGGDTLIDVGTKAPNELGLYDMSGNATEWVQDYFGTYAALLGIDDPCNTTYNRSRIIRGGNCSYEASACRVSHRLLLGESSWNAGTTLRLVCQE
ncbi:MAG: SUMF1/EgtB/PvdO family nonheme iron enzyme [Muribaculaceae bacterium]|nr:SUMF1/EgtB/PvdO family nonheme iron enzyme [Muribaculaceae bacterium]